MSLGLCNRSAKLKQESGFRVLYTQNDFPVLQNKLYFSRADAIACPRGDIQLVEDLKTGLIYNKKFNDELVIYDQSYQNEQGHSLVFKAHLEQVLGLISQYMSGKRLVEVGCGKGMFVELLQFNGFDVCGLDPAYEGSNSKIDREYFTSELGRQFDGVILRHVLEHVENPFEFLNKLNRANRSSGLIYIEVPSFEWICEKRAWFDIFYEHVNYFRLTDFYRMFERVVAAGYLFGGQYMYVIANLNSLREPIFDSEDSIDFPVNFDTSLRSEAVASSSVVWGASSKGVIFSLLRERIGFPVGIIIDINPEKQGKFIPVTGLCVKSPVDALGNMKNGESICVMNCNYFDEIKRMSGAKYNYIRIEND